MKGKYLLMNLVLAGMLIACNFSNKVVESAIAKTETARPIATFTLTPTDTPSPNSTPVPTDTPEPSPTPTPTTVPSATVPPTPSVSLADAVLSVSDLNSVTELFLPEVTDTGYAGNSLCELECVAKQYRYDKDQYRLVVELAMYELREAAIEITSQFGPAAGENEFTFIPIPEQAVLGESGILQFSVDREVLPKDMMILQFEPYLYYAVGSYGPILIEMNLENRSGLAIEPEEASSILSSAMSMQILNLAVAYYQ